MFQNCAERVQGWRVCGIGVWHLGDSGQSFDWGILRLQLLKLD